MRAYSWHFDVDVQSEVEVEAVEIKAYLTIVSGLGVFFGGAAALSKRVYPAEKKDSQKITRYDIAAEIPYSIDTNTLWRILDSEESIRRHRDYPQNWQRFLCRYLQAIDLANRIMVGFLTPSGNWVGNKLHYGTKPSVMSLILNPPETPRSGSLNLNQVSFKHQMESLHGPISASYNPAPQTSGNELFPEVQFAPSNPW